MNRVLSHGGGTRMKRGTPMNAPEPPSDARKPTKPTNPQPALDEDLRRAVSGSLTDLIRRQVVRTLGSPVNLLGVHVRPLWDDRYRVNVVVGKDITTSRVANSFFLVADGDGNILRSSPEIARLY
jgi:hypothetical protein